MEDDNGWERSAGAWIASLGSDGDFSRRFVLDAPTLARVRGRGFKAALDVGCGEGRFCRMLKAEGVRAIGVDPTPALIAEARRLDPAGDYREGRAEALDLPDSAFDLVVSYLSLLDIDDAPAAIGEMTRVLAPGGSLLVVNQNGFATAAVGGGWTAGPDGEIRFEIDQYLETRAQVARWRGIAIRNWHRPLETYMRAFLAEGLRLTHFAEPAPYGGPADKADRYRRVPLFFIAEWAKL